MAGGGGGGDDVDDSSIEFYKPSQRVAAYIINITIQS